MYCSNQILRLSSKANIDFQTIIIVVSSADQFAPFHTISRSFCLLTIKAFLLAVRRSGVYKRVGRNHFCGNAPRQNNFFEIFAAAEAAGSTVTYSSCKT